MGEIITLGNEILRKDSINVENIDDDLIAHLDEMFRMMRDGDGIGLAAPQAGINRCYFVCNIPEDKPREFINPVITATSPELSEIEEGCLSIPKIYAEVKRAAYVSVQAFDRRGKVFNLEAQGLLARVILHEYDHLKGVLFIDHISEKKRQKLLKQYQRKAG